MNLQANHWAARDRCPVVGLAVTTTFDSAAAAVWRRARSLHQSRSVARGLGECPGPSEADRSPVFVSYRFSLGRRDLVRGWTFAASERAQDRRARCLPIGDHRRRGELDAKAAQNN